MSENFSAATTAAMSISIFFKFFSGKNGWVGGRGIHVAYEFARCTSLGSANASGCAQVTQLVEPDQMVQDSLHVGE